MSSFQDARIALLEARMSGEMANLIRRHGGNPYGAPALREAPLDAHEEVAVFLNHLKQAAIHTVVFLTGAGASALFKEAENLGRLPELLDALQKVTVVCRGPKPMAALKRQGIPVLLSAKEPYTTEELLEVLATLQLQGQTVAVVQYGERSLQLAQYLEARGAELEELCLYEWQLPEDITPLQSLVRDIIEQRLDAVVFTSQVQARHLFMIAEGLQLKDELTNALNTRTIVASIGPTCTGTLMSYGVRPHVIPEHPKMGHLVKALSDYMNHDHVQRK